MTTEASGLILLCGADRDRDACLAFAAALEAAGHETRVIPARPEALHAAVSPNVDSPGQVCRPEVAVLLSIEVAGSIARRVATCETLSPIPVILVADEDSVSPEDLVALDLYAWLPPGTGARALVATVDAALGRHRLEQNRVARPLAEQGTPAELQQSLTELEALRGVALELAAELDLDRLLESVVVRAVSLMDAGGGGLYLYDEAQDELVRSTSVGSYPPPLGTRRARGEGLSGTVWAENRPLSVSDYRTWEARAASPPDAAPAGVLGVPVQWGEEFLGVLTVSALPERRAPFTDEDMHLLALFATHAAIAVHNARIYESSHRLQAFHEQLIQQMTEGLEVADAETRITFVNPAGAAMLGYDVDELLGRRSADIIPPDQTSVMTAANERRRHGERDRYRIELLRKDGSRLPTMVSGAPRFDEVGDYIGTLAVFTDISEQVAAERALRHRVALERMLIDIAMDFVAVEPDDLDTMIDGALAEMGDFLAMDYGFVFLYDLASDSVGRTHVWSREGAPLATIGHLSPSHFPWWMEKLRMQEAVHIPSLEMLPPTAARERELLTAQGVEGTVAMPLLLADELMGFLGFATREGMAPWSDEDLALLRLLAGIVGTALTRQTTLLQVTQQADRLRFVHELGQALATTLDVGDICRTVYDQLRTVIEVTSFNVTRYDAEQDLFYPLYEVSRGHVLDLAEIEPARLDAKNSIIGRAVLGQETLVVDDFQIYQEDLEPLGPREDERCIQAVLTAPMVVEREVVGALQVQSQQSTVYTEEDARLLSAVANQVGLAVQNARLLEQARDQAQRLQEVMESVPDGVLLVDAATGEVLLANPAGERAATVLADVGVGERLTDVAERPWRSWLRPAPHGMWHEIVVAGPPQRIFELTARPVHRVRRTGLERHGAEDGAPIAWVMVIRDVTEERLRAERAQQQDRLAAVGQLAAGIAHDFSNIMAVIVLYAQMSQTVDDVPEQVLARLKTIVDQARSASDLIQQILDFSRSSTLERRRLDLTRFVKEQVQMLRRMVPEHIEVEMVYGPEEHVVHADATSIQQVVMNLAVNARDAMPQGGRFTLALDRIEILPDERPPLPGMAPGAWVRLTATDTGVGIEPEVLPHIFDPFFTTKGQDGGTGLGLAQVHGIVKQHDGEIDVVSAPGEGTTFRLYLPAVPPKDAALDENQDEDHLPHGEGETVLVVEDAMAARASLVESLRVLNYMPIEASNGLEALAAFEDAAGLVDLVLTDLVMPDMGGRDLVTALRDRGIQTPVILLSGHILSEDPLGLSDEGVTEFIRKPVHLPALARVVARALGVS